MRIGQVRFRMLPSSMWTGMRNSEKWLFFCFFFSPADSSRLLAAVEPKSCIMLACLPRRQNQPAQHLPCAAKILDAPVSLKSKHERHLALLGFSRWSGAAWESKMDAMNTQCRWAVQLQRGGFFFFILINVFFYPSNCRFIWIVAKNVHLVPKTFFFFITSHKVKLFERCTEWELWNSLLHIKHENVKKWLKGTRRSLLSSRSVIIQYRK